MPSLRPIVVLVLSLLTSLAALSAQDRRPPRRDRGPEPGPGRYTIAQATSERAQLHTIAFDGLAFLTGDFCCDTFLPPGKVADYFGFQYLRDTDVSEKGHNTSFLTRIAGNMLKILTPEQLQQFVVLGKEQAPMYEELARKRFPLIAAFRRNLAGEFPKGRTGLDAAAVAKYSAGLFEFGAGMAWRRAEVTGAVYRTFTDEQKAALAKLKFGDSSTWPDVGEPFDKRSVKHEVHVAVMTYASEMFSWIAGSQEADTYFCPEGHGTYFGAFFLKDAPAMGKRDYSISTSLTGDSGERFLQLLDEKQRERITSIPAAQQKALQEIVAVRREISDLLRGFLTGPKVDREAVLAKARRYGELDGELSCLYATRFAEVGRTLTEEQRRALRELRNLDDYPCRGAYLYSRPIDPPDVRNTDFLFGGK